MLFELNSAFIPDLKVILLPLSGKRIGIIMNTTTSLETLMWLLLYSLKVKNYELNQYITTSLHIQHRPTQVYG